MNNILIVNFGSRCLDKITIMIQKHYPNIETDIKHWKDFDINELSNYIGIILSGGPDHLYDSDCPIITPEILNTNIPVLGICYGMQLLAKVSGANVALMNNPEFGNYDILLLEKSSLFDKLTEKITVHMQHYDQVLNLTGDFKVVAHNSNCIAAIESVNKRLYGIQFHPEMDNEYGIGEVIINNFIEICKKK